MFVCEIPEPSVKHQIVESGFHLFCLSGSLTEILE